MFEYFIAVQQNTMAAGLLLALLSVRAAGTATGAPVTVGTTDTTIKPASKHFLKAVLAGFAVAAILTILKAFTAWINTELWNMGFMAAVLATALAFLLTDFGLLFRGHPPRAAWLHRWSLTLLAALLVTYALRGSLLYMREFVLQDESILDVDVLYRILGWLAAFCVVALATAGMTVVARRLDRRPLRLIGAALLVVYLVQGVLSITQALYARHLIPRAPWLRDLLTLVINHNDAFLYATMLLALIMVTLALLTQQRMRRETSASGLNPAQRRKGRARWRTLCRWSSVVALGFVVALFSTTVVKAYTEREVVLTPAEPLEYVGDEARIPLARIEDGHLHRFAHVSTTGTEVRFIIIKKNEIAYGVGLDACMICGATGYYERDDQVVCKMCDVVMNKQTIGFAGGCNPIPLEFVVEEGVLTVQVSDLEAGAEWFE